MFKKSPALRWYVLLLTATILLALILPVTPNTLQQLHISTTQYKLTIVSLILPYALIWLSAFYAYQQLQRYAASVAKSKEGRAFQHIADGVRVLAWGIVLPSLLSVIFGAIEAWHHSFRPIHVIVDNYVTLVVALLGFTFIGAGTRKLIELVKVRTTLSAFRVAVFGYISLGVLFTYFVIHNFKVNGNPYYLPLAILMATLIIPYLYVWFLGLVSAFELYTYGREIKGLLYKQALGWLQHGISIIIAASIFTQYLVSSIPTNGRLSFSIMIVVAYILLIIEAIGYVCVAYGARRLTHIEEV